MPNARLIRQDQEAAQKRYLNYAAQIEGYNAEVDRVNAANQSASDLYNQQAAEYNAFVNNIKAGQQLGVGEYAPGSFTLMKGYTDDNGVPGITAYTADKRGNPQLAGGLVDKLPEADVGSTGGAMLQGQLNGVWLKNGDGTATFHTWNPGYNTVDLGGGDGGGGYTTTQTGTPGWEPSTYTARLMQFNTPSPTAQEVSTPAPEQPKGWNPSLREIEEVQAPTADAAGVQMAAARGESAKTGLVNEAIGRESAFADPEDPNNLADKGILARVLGGQL